MRMLSLATATLFLAATSAAGFASTLTVSQSGVFSSTAPIPNGSFSYSFDIHSLVPAPGVAPGHAFYPVVSDFSYTVNGVSASTTGDAQFFNTFNGEDYPGIDLIVFVGGRQSAAGALEVDINDQLLALAFDQTQVILPGSYAPTKEQFAGLSGASSLASESNVNIAVAATPEPSSIALLGTGVLGIAGLVRKRFI